MSRGSRRANSCLDSQYRLLRRLVLVTPVAFGAGHIPNHPGNRPEIVRQVVGFMQRHGKNRLPSPTTLDNGGAVEDTGELVAGASFLCESVRRSGDGGNNHLHNPIIPNVSSGDDTEPELTDLALSRAMDELASLVASGEYVEAGEPE